MKDHNDVKAWHNCSLGRVCVGVFVHKEVILRVLPLTLLVFNLYSCVRLL